MDYIKNTIAENFGGPSHNLVDEKNYFDLEQVPDLAGKVAVLTGGTEGIGFGCAHTLLRKNISKLFVCASTSPYMWLRYLGAPRSRTAPLIMSRSCLSARKSQMKLSQTSRTTLVRRLPNDSSGSNVISPIGNRRPRSRTRLLSKPNGLIF